MLARRVGWSNAALLKKVEIMNGLKISLAGAVLLLAAPSAMGASIESRERAAKKACLVGDVDKGAEILADLYVDTNDVGFIYNQARCFEQNGKNAQSALRFKEYLRKAKNLSQADIDAVLKKIDELQGAAGDHAAQPAPAPLPLPAAQPSAAAAASAVPPSTTPGVDLTASNTSTDSTQADSHFYRTWWFWTGTAAVVVAGTVTAIFLAGRSSDPCDGASRSCVGVK
jgi:hypothetical protein